MADLSLKSELEKLQRQVECLEMAADLLKNVI